MASPSYDWSSMHTSILGTIFQFLKDSEFDRRRVAAVCASWRSTISFMPAAQNLTFNLPDIEPFNRSLNKYTFYILSSNQSSTGISKVWLIRVQQPEPDKWVLHNPFLSSSSSQRRRPRFTLNLLGNFRIVEAVRSYELYSKLPEAYFEFELLPELAEANDELLPELAEANDELLPELAEDIFYLREPNAKKVIVISKSTLILFKSGKLSVVYEQQWINLETSTTGHCYKDIVSFQDEFYAIDVEGILIKLTIARDNNTKPKLIPVLIASTAPLQKNETPYLVTSNGDLYLIIKKIDKRVKNKPIVNCRTYVLNKRTLIWIQVSSLRNMVFFLLKGVSFSVSATELGWSRGNFIYLHVSSDSEVKRTRQDGREFIWVYNLNDSKITTDLKDFPQPVYSPPPNWVTLTPN